MKENRKGLVIAIIVLFVGASVVPSISGVIETDHKETNGEKDTAVIKNLISMDSIIGIEGNVPIFDGDITVVSIQPPAQEVEKGEEFTVGIYVEPSEPIIGVYVDIYFDPTLIQADWPVVAGDLFDGPYYLYHGDIDNINGSITGICIVCLVPGGASDPGYFVYISFIAQQELGTSPLDIQNVHIANINGDPLPSTVIDGEVTVGESPQITNVMLMTSDPLDTEPGFGWENITCTVTSDIAVNQVKLNVTYYVWWEGWWKSYTKEYSMTNTPETDTYYYNTTLTDAGRYDYYIWADDAIGNAYSSEIKRFYLPANEDVDMNGEVYFADFICIVLRYGETGPPGWIREDVNNDGHVNFWDFANVIIHYGEYW